MTLDLSKLSHEELVALGRAIRDAEQAQHERERVERAEKAIAARRSSRLAVLEERLAEMREQADAWRRLTEALRNERAEAEAAVEATRKPSGRRDADRRLRDAEGSLAALEADWKREATPALLWSVADGLAVDLRALRPRWLVEQKIAELEEERRRLAEEAEAA